jgi:hypothetical protein
MRLYGFFLLSSLTFASFFFLFCTLVLVISYTHLIQGDLNILLVVFQAITAVICVEGCRYVGLVDYPPLTWNTVKSWAPVNMFFCLMLFSKFDPSLRRSAT